MPKKIFISLFLLIAIWIFTRVFIAIQYNMWDFNTEEDYKVYYINTNEIIEMREELK